MSSATTTEPTITTRKEAEAFLAAGGTALRRKLYKAARVAATRTFPGNENNTWGGVFMFPEGPARSVCHRPAASTPTRLAFEVLILRSDNPDRGFYINMSCPA